MAVGATATQVIPWTRCPHSLLSPTPPQQSPATRWETGAHPGACMRPMMAADRQRKRERGLRNRRKPPSTQEVTSHVPASSRARGRATLSGSRRPRDYISRNAFQCSSRFLSQRNHISQHASVTGAARGWSGEFESSSSRYCALLEVLPEARFYRFKS